MATMPTRVHKVLKWFALRRAYGKRFGFCLHPASALTVFHFASKGPDGRYLPDRICAHLCGLCMTYVKVPKCKLDRHRCSLEKA